MDRQLKEQFIHGLNYTEMLKEIIKELTKVHKEIISENVLSWEKKFKVPRAQSAHHKLSHDGEGVFINSK